MSAKKRKPTIPKHTRTRTATGWKRAKIEELGLNEKKLAQIRVPTPAETTQKAPQARRRGRPKANP